MPLTANDISRAADARHKIQLRRLRIEHEINYLRAEHEYLTVLAGDLSVANSTRDIERVEQCLSTP